MEATPITAAHAKLPACNTSTLAISTLPARKKARRPAKRMAFFQRFPTASPLATLESPLRSPLGIVDHAHAGIMATAASRSAKLFGGDAGPYVSQSIARTTPTSDKEPVSFRAQRAIEEIAGPR